MTLSQHEARSFFVRRHLLAPPRSLPSTSESVLAIVARFGSLQFDPLEVTGARNHDLVLFARVADYRRSLCDELLYPRAGTHRPLFEAYNKSLNLLPTSELPWHRFAWKRASQRHAGELLAEHATLARHMLARLRKEGPLAPSDFDATLGKRTVVGHWGVATSLTRHVLDALFMIGRVGIASRQGNRRTYDLMERLFDHELLARRVSEAESIRHRLLSRHRAVGLMGRNAAPELVGGIATAAGRRRHLDALVDRGALHAVTVEGVRGPRYIVDTDRALLAKPAKIRPRVSFLGPLDPFVWDRDLVRELFAFDYKWEVYTPIAERSHGYYVLPILFGDRLVGRVEPRFLRAESRLHVVGLWFERGFDPETPGFVDAFGETLRAFARFVGSKETKLGRGKTCRWIAVRLPS